MLVYLYIYNENNNKKKDSGLMKKEKLHTWTDTSSTNMFPINENRSALKVD